MSQRQSAREDERGGRPSSRWGGRLGGRRPGHDQGQGCGPRRGGISPRWDGLDGRICWHRRWRRSPPRGRDGRRRTFWDGNRWGGLRLLAAGPAVWQRADGCWVWEGRSARGLRRVGCGGGDPLLWGCAVCLRQSAAARPAPAAATRAGYPAPDRGPAGRSRCGGFFRRNGLFPRTFCAVLGCGPR